VLKKFGGEHFTLLSGSPLFSDFYETQKVNWFWGLRSSDTLKTAVSHRHRASPLQQCYTTVLHSDSKANLTTINCKLTTSNNCMLHCDMNLYYVYLESRIFMSSFVFSLAFCVVFYFEFVCYFVYLLLLCPARRERGNKRCFCLSVRRLHSE